MLVLSDAPFAGCWLSRASAAAAALLGLMGVIGCRSERSAGAAEREIVTRVEMVRPAVERVRAQAATSAKTAGDPAAVRASAAEAAEADAVEETAEYCKKVELQARETNASLPKRLDKDTSATRVVAYGCDVVLEYAMLDLRVGDVALAGVTALRGEVLEKLCSDGGARGVLNHGGSFTNVYRDDQSALIDQFTIAEADCWDRRSADGTPARIGL
jgi:hypothetical protein